MTFNVDEQTMTAFALGMVAGAIVLIYVVSISRAFSFKPQKKGGPEQ